VTQPETQAPPEARPVAPSLDLEAILAAALLESRDQREKQGRIFATDLGTALGPDHSGCPRAWWGKCRDEEQKPPTPGKLLMFKMGELMEEYIISVLKEALPTYGWEFVCTQERYEGYQHRVGAAPPTDGCSGRLDIKIRHTETGAIRIIDVKSKRGGAFDFLNEVKPDNELQVQFYGEREAEANPDVPIGLDILYADREGSNFVKHFEVERADDRPVEAHRRLRILRDGPEPEPLKPTLKRVPYQKHDSLYLNEPWQVKWCDLKQCVCAKSIGKLPEGIVAKIMKPNKNHEFGLLVMTEGCEKWADRILAMLKEKYPDEDIRPDIKLETK
jgi:hypothetical protein